MADEIKCRHRGGTKDCPKICWLLFGDRFLTVPASAIGADQ